MESLCQFLYITNENNEAEEGPKVVYGPMPIVRYVKKKKRKKKMYIIDFNTTQKIDVIN